MNSSLNQKRKLPVLSSRLEAIAGMVAPNVPRVIDIGTDHAYLPISLISRDMCSSAIASDLQPGPAAIAEANVKKYGLAQSIEIRIGDGLEGIEIEKSDNVIIAGMGGLEIMKILDRPLPDSSVYILQPQKSVAELRVWLIEKGFVIADEILVKDRKHYYVIIKVIYDNTASKTKSLDQLSAWIGPVLLEKSRNNAVSSHDWFSYLREKRTILAKAKRSDPELTYVVEQLDQLINKK